MRVFALLQVGMLAALCHVEMSDVGLDVMEFSGPLRTGRGRSGRQVLASDRAHLGI